MSLIRLKKQVFGQIAAAKTLAEGMPRLRLNSSFPSINNSGDAIAFLCDLIKSLIGFEDLEKKVTETLVYYSKPIEQEVKNLLKTELKSIVSCGVDPSLPAWIKSTGDGIKIRVKKIDFTDLMLIDPNSETGNLVYDDLTPNLINSSDFNTFLYQVIQNNGSVETWPNGPVPPILTFQFKQTDVNNIDPNNTLTIRAHSSYDNRTLTELNNNYIDSITLFNLENLMTNIFDSIFGTVTSAVNRSLSQIQNQLKINTVIDKITNADAKDIISDKYFNFTDKENSLHEQEARLKRLGVKPENFSNKINTRIALSSIQKLNSDIKAAGSDLNQTKNALNNSLRDVGNQLAAFTQSPSDQQSIKTNFIQEIINKLVKTIVNSILSPKVIAIFVINFKIVYGPNEDFTDAVDFMKKNKNLVQNIIKRVTGIIIRELMKIAMKKISELAIEKQKKILIDKGKAKVSQLLSLIGIPQDTIRKIRGLT
jgi:hypothetical protein